MRIALLSDQHANDVAFAAVTADVERVGADRVFCLGDTTQGGAQPAETLDRLAGLGCETVLGNADALLLGHEVAEELTPEQMAVRDWTLSKLEERHLEQLRSFPLTLEVELGDCGLVLFHASPRSYDDILLPDNDADVEPWLVEADLLAGGHTHLQWTRRIGDALFVNPGSVGVVYDRLEGTEMPRLHTVAEYALVTLGPDGAAVEFRRVPYSPEELRSAVLASGRPNAERHLSLYGF